MSYLINELGLPSDSKILPATYSKKGKVKINAPNDEGKEGKEGDEDAVEDAPTKGE